MPEGDTVFAAAARLRKALAGHRIDHCQFRIPSLATVDLTGQEVTAVRSVGKHLLIDTADVSIHSHLKMEGAWHVHRVGQRWRRPGFEARIVLRANGSEAVGFALGILELLEDPDATLAYLGPDLLGEHWDAAEAVRRLAADPDREIGEALLDQRNLAGIGNVYRSEICFLRGVASTRPVAEVNLPPMVELARKMLWANRLRTTRTTTGNTAPNARMWVYGRRGHGCRRCQTPIERVQLGSIGGERVIYFCPRCQS
ncbi:DNA-formamidopyrimidine glycosylase family protein [Gordonia sp. CPCC 205515]|uniref:DNA-formamidopyrimidine glycosylase family protein n=1 Tax=Gordonia sp. CPCC 205515 TaxID=3140791 RepID=UPI003AF3FB38